MMDFVCCGTGVVRTLNSIEIFMIYPDVGDEWLVITAFSIWTFEMCTGYLHRHGIDRVIVRNVRQNIIIEGFAIIGLRAESVYSAVPIDIHDAESFGLHEG